MRKTLLLLFVLLTALPAFGQGVRLDDVVIRASAGFGGATIRVCTSAATGTPCTPLASIFSDRALTVAKPNPFTADSSGNYNFYAASSVYIVQISGSGITTQSLEANLSIPGTTLLNTDSSLAGGGQLGAGLTLRINLNAACSDGNIDKLLWNNTTKTLFCGVDQSSTTGIGITTINSQIGGTQTLVTGTAGIDFAISSAANIHTFNIPDAGATARGLVTTGVQTIAGSKTFSSPVIGANALSGEAFRVGDDASLWDVGVANTMQVRGVQNVTQGFINFGNGNGLRIGFDGDARYFTLSNTAHRFDGRIDFALDNTYDIGFPVSNRPRSIFLGNTITNRRVVLWTDADNDHQFYGFGIESGVLRAQIPSTAGFFRWYRGDSPTASTKIMELTVTGQLVLPVATGTAPLSVTSTTVNTNLNADLLDGISSAGFMQVGANPVTVTDAPAVGEVLQATSTTQAAWQPPPTSSGTFAYKVADEIVNNSSVMQNDDHLTLTLVASTKYYIEAILFVRTADVTSGVKFNWAAGTASENNAFIQAAMEKSDGNSSHCLRVGLNSGAPGDCIFTFPAAATDQTVKIKGTIEVNFGGTFTIKWAQNTAVVADTTVRRGSILIVQSIP